MTAGHVVANSEEIDSWLRNCATCRRHDLISLTHVERTLKLRAEAQRTRQTLHQMTETLMREVAAVYAAVQKSTRTSCWGDGRRQGIHEKAFLRQQMSENERLA